MFQIGKCPHEWAFCFPKHPAFCVWEMSLNKVPCRYWNKNPHKVKLRWARIPIMQNWMHHFYFFIFVLWYWTSTSQVSWQQKVTHSFWKAETPISMAISLFKMPTCCPCLIRVCTVSFACAATKYQGFYKLNTSFIKGKRWEIRKDRIQAIRVLKMWNHYIKGDVLTTPALLHLKSSHLHPTQ